MTALRRTTRLTSGATLAALLTSAVCFGGETPGGGAALTGVGTPATSAAVVELEAVGSTDPPVGEALLRIQAELRAVGFGVRLVDGTASEGALPAPVGRLLLIRTGNTVQILAHGASPDAPLTQQVDLSRTSSTAEVVAIRAVEALRAALVQSLRDKSLRDGEVADAVLTFTQWSEARREPSADPEPAQALSAEKAVPHENAEEAPVVPARGSHAWLLALGPLLQKPAPDASFAAGAELLILRTFGLAYVGAGVDGSLSPARWRTERGTIEAREASLLVRGGVALPCSSPLVCRLGVGFGVRHTSFIATPSGETKSEAAEHSSALAEADSLLGYFVNDTTGVLLHGRLGAALDAPSLRAGAERADSWGRPSYGVALSGAFRF